MDVNEKDEQTKKHTQGRRPPFVGPGRRPEAAMDGLYRNHLH
jgi:hypothetical protein